MSAPGTEVCAVHCCNHNILFRIASDYVSGSSSICLCRRKCPVSLFIPVQSNRLFRNQIIPPRTSFPPQSRQIPSRSLHNYSPHHLSFPHPPYLPPQIQFASLPYSPTQSNILLPWKRFAYP